MLANLFKPKWQHSNPTTRASAALKLREDQPDQFRILSKLATTDPDAEVRTVALAQIEQFDHLIALLNFDTPYQPEFERKIADQINASSSPHSLVERLNHLTNTTMTLRIVASSQHTVLLEALVADIDCEQQLAELAISAAPIAVRKQAAQRIQSTPVIEQLMKTTRQRDKTIYKIIKDTLTAAKEAERIATEHYAKAEQIAEQMNTLANGEWFPLFIATYENVCHAWQSLASPYQIPYTSRFKEGNTLASERINAHQEALRQQQHAQQQQAAAVEQAEGLIRTVNTLLATQDTEQLLHSADLHTQLIQTLDQYQRQWQTEQLSAKTTLAKAFQRAQTQARDELHRLAQCQTHRQNVHAFLATIDTPTFSAQTLSRRLKMAQEIAQALQWPASIPYPSELTQLDHLITTLQQQSHDQGQNIAALNTKIQQQLVLFTEAIDSGAIKVAHTLARTLQGLFDQLDGTADISLQHQYRGLQAQLQELKEWQGFAVTPKKEQLCTEMEWLAEQPIAPPQKAKQIKKLQHQWRVLDATDPVHSQALWRRFKTAADNAYAPCETYFTAQSQARAYNLSQRQAIYDHVTSYLQATDWQHIPWRDVEKVLHTAKDEWRRFIPVDRGPGQQLQTAFNTLTAPVEAHLKAIKETAKQQKLDLIQQATALTQHNDPAEAAEAAKRLQQQWKAAGPTFHSQERKLWRTFRDQCDIIFAHLQATQPSPEQQRAHKATIQNMLTSLESCIDAPRHSRLVLAEAQLLIDRLSTEGVSSKELQRLNKALDELSKAQTQLAKTLDENTDSRRLAKQYDQLEQTIIADNPADTLRTEIDHLLAVTKTDLKARAEVLIKILDGNLTLAEQQPLVGQQLRSFAVQLEVLLNEASPQEDEALRMEYQMQRLQQNLAGHRQTTLANELASLEHAWLAVPFKRLYPELCERFDSIFNDLLS